MCFLTFAFIALFWASAEAFRRRALYRVQIFLAALGVPVAFGSSGYAVSRLINIAKYPIWLIASAGTLCLGLYMACAFGVVIWAHRARIEPQRRGFPIEPIDSVTPKDSDPV